MKVGVLALQGDVPEHRRALAELVPPSSVVLVRRASDLADLDALLLPGGESTTIAQLLRNNGMWEPLAARLREGLPTLATCAGLILVAGRLEHGAGGTDPPTFGVLDVTVRRNDYGAQVDSFEAPVEVEGVSGRPFPGVFIRAPKLVGVGPGARAFVRLGAEVVGARSRTVWALTFHPELSEDPRILAAFLASAEPEAHPNQSRATRTTSKAAPSRPAAQ